MYFQPMTLNYLRSLRGMTDRLTYYSWGILAPSQRADILEEVARLAGDYNVVYHLDRSRLCRLAECPIGRVLPLTKHRRPDSIRMIAREGRFGRDYYELLSSAKIVLNGSIDMAGEDRGNMRCFEALGAGSLLLSDQGNYPDGMNHGQTIATYGSAAQAVMQVKTLLEDCEKRSKIAQDGHQMVSTRYSKEAQWKRFETIVASI
jgi:glycosyltransferase involved in cell wall biosynthesis